MGSTVTLAVQVRRGLMKYVHLPISEICLPENTT